MPCSHEVHLCMCIYNSYLTTLFPLIHPVWQLLNLSQFPFPFLSPHHLRRTLRCSCVSRVCLLVSLYCLNEAQDHACARKLSCSSALCCSPYTTLTMHRMFRRVSSTHSINLEEMVAHHSEQQHHHHRHDQSPWVIHHGPASTAHDDAPSKPQSEAVATPDLNMLLIPPSELAQQITLLDLDSFQSISLREFEKTAWLKPDKASMAPGIVRMTKRFNMTSKWVISELLNAHNRSDRVQKLLHFIKIAKKLHEYNNLHGLLAVLSGLQSASIYRLHNTWRNLKEKYADKLDRLEEFVSGDENYKQMREHLTGSKLPCIPYLGLYLTDLIHLNTAIKEGKGDIDHHHSEVRRVYETIRRFQESTYSFTIISFVRSYLEAIPYNEETIADEERKQYEASLQIEPHRKADGDSDADQDFVLASPDKSTWIASMTNRITKSGSLPFRPSSKGKGHRRSRSLTSSFPHFVSPGASSSSSSRQEGLLLADSFDDSDGEAAVGAAPEPHPGRQPPSFSLYHGRPLSPIQASPGALSPEGSFEAQAAEITPLNARTRRASSPLSRTSHKQLVGLSLTPTLKRRSDSFSMETSLPPTSPSPTSAENGTEASAVAHAQPEDFLGGDANTLDDDDDDDEDPFGVAAPLPLSRSPSRSSREDLDGPDSDTTLHEGVVKTKMLYKLRTHKYYWARLTPIKLHLHAQKSKMKGLTTREAFNATCKFSFPLQDITIASDPSDPAFTVRSSMHNLPSRKLHLPTVAERDAWVRHLAIASAAAETVTDIYSPSRPPIHAETPFMADELLSATQ
eukprot:m.201724 g.201724  ORF g.201724 m.201724 type:complete len:795 (-) comp14968_c0_seq1:327-2711(-)